MIHSRADGASAPNTPLVFTISASGASHGVASAQTNTLTRIILTTGGVRSLGTLALDCLGRDDHPTVTQGHGRFGMLVQCVMLFGVYLLVLLQILRSLERFLADGAPMRFQRCVDYASRSKLSGKSSNRTGNQRTSKMTCYMIPLCANDSATFPVTSQAQVVRRLSTDMHLTQVLI